MRRSNESNLVALLGRLWFEVLMENLSLPLAQGDLFFLFAHSGHVAGLQRVPLFNTGVGLPHARRRLWREFEGFFKWGIVIPAGI